MAIDSSNKVPGSYLDVVLGVGARSPGDAARRIVLNGYRLSTGTSVVERLVQVTNPDDAATLFGQGSELHRMVKAALAVNPNANLWAVPINEPGAGAAAAKTITFVNAATSDGSILLEICGVQITVAIPSGSAIAAMALLVRDAINNLPDLPVTASAALGVTTITARHKGLRGNRHACRSSGTVGGVTITHASGYMTGGTTVDSLTNAFAELAPERFNYIVAPQDDSATLQLWRTQVNTYAAPLEGKRQVVVAASIDTLANSITIAQAVNAERVQIAWHYNADNDPCVIAASLAALRALLESIDIAVPIFGATRASMSTLLTQPVAADRPLASENASALNAGLTPLQATRSGVVYVVRSITTKSLDSGSKPFYSVLDTSKVQVPDYVADDLDLNWEPLAATNPKQGPNPAEGESPPAGVLTPLMVRDFVYGRLKEHEAQGRIVNVDALLPSLVVTIPTSPAGRFALTCPVDVIEGAYQLDGAVRQVG